MSQKDITEKALESYNDVFADILNVLLFDGKAVVSEDELADAAPRSQYKAGGRLHEQERDVAKYWNHKTLHIALYGLENQTTVDADMPLRLFSYDGAAYRSQLLSDRKGTKTSRYPVVTLVLYFGYNKPWTEPVTLHECLILPEQLKPFVNDYKMNLFQIAYLSPEQVQQFQSDFRWIADYFVQMRQNHTYQAPSAVIHHVHEFLQLMSVLTQDIRFEQVYNSNMEGGHTTMCEILDQIEGRGIEKGMALGLSEGLSQGFSQGISRSMALTRHLIVNNRLEDLKRATEDEEYRNHLLHELFPE